MIIKSQETQKVSWDFIKFVSYCIAFLYIQVSEFCENLAQILFIHLYLPSNQAQHSTGFS